MLCPKMYTTSPVCAIPVSVCDRFNGFVLVNTIVLMLVYVGILKVLALNPCRVRAGVSYVQYCTQCHLCP